MQGLHARLADRCEDPISLYFILLSQSIVQGGHTMNFKRQVNVTFGKNPIVDGEAFLFEVAPSDVPYGIYGRDCVQIAQVVGQGAIPFCRKRDGKLISAEQRDRNLYTLLTTAIPSVRGGKVFMGDQEVSGDTSEHLSNI
ncbi:MAG TPA: hypothetical protein VJH22_05250, partial [Candidatus Nanoarchaeia archaeon]|nr:hypothetical protein [Candidatus Nanoarchaeia archaeon]